MSEKKYRVPDAMLRAAIERMEMPDTAPYMNQVEKVLEAAIRWLAENPIRPNAEQLESMTKLVYAADSSFTVAPKLFQLAQEYLMEWQHRMFLAPTDTKREKVLSVIMQETHISIPEHCDSCEKVADAVLAALEGTNGTD